MKNIMYSEIFGHTIQGEGHYTGVPTVWVRFYMCNLQCAGFGQEHPTQPNTWKEPYKEIDLTNIETVEELPVFEYGCDSSYTWAKRFKHLMKSETAPEIVDKLTDLMKNDYNERGLFTHPHSNMETHMAFTGGEPMLNQDAMIAILKEFDSRDNMPRYITIETNGTKKIKDEFGEYLNELASRGIELFWSVSPKLWNTAGEKNAKAIRPDVIYDYQQYSTQGQLKFVVDGSESSWDELEHHITTFKSYDLGIDFPIWIMPAGATKEQQETDIVAEITREAIKRGYNVAGRMHSYIFKNAIGT